MRFSAFLEDLIKVIRSGGVDIRNFLIIVPHYNVVPHLANEIANLVNLNVAFMPRFMNFTDFYLHLKMTFGESLRIASRIELRLMMFEVMSRRGISIKHLDEVYEKVIGSSFDCSYLPEFVEMREEIIEALDESGYVLPSLIDEEALRWMLDASSKIEDARIFILSPREYEAYLRSVGDRENVRIVFQPEYQMKFKSSQIIEFCNKAIAARYVASKLEEGKLIIDAGGYLGKLILQQIDFSYKSSILDTRQYKVMSLLFAYWLDQSNIDNLLSIVQMIGMEIEIFAMDSDVLKEKKRILEERIGSNEEFVNILSRVRCGIKEGIDGESALNILKSAIDSLCVADYNWEFENWYMEVVETISRHKVSVSRNFGQLIASFAKSQSLDNQLECAERILNLHQIDYMQFSDIILIENGLSGLEKGAIEESKNKLHVLNQRLAYAVSQANVTIIRVHEASCTGSIFYTRAQHFGVRREVVTSWFKRDEMGRQPGISVPPESRPRKLSVTDISKLMDNPYVYYLSAILKLSPRKYFWEGQENKFFGLAAHEWIASKTQESDWVLDKYHVSGGLAKIWDRKLQNIRRFIAEYKHERGECVEYNEIYGAIELLDLKILGIADMIEINNDKEVCIVDYKTGTVPSLVDIKTGKEPQLELENLILNRGGFKDIKTDKSAVGRYIGIAGRERSNKVMDVHLDHERTERCLHALLKMFYQRNECYTAAPYADGKWSKLYWYLIRSEEWEGC